MKTRIYAAPAVKGLKPMILPMTLGLSETLSLRSSKVLFKQTSRSQMLNITFNETAWNLTVGNENHNLVWQVVLHQ